MHRFRVQSESAGAAEEGRNALRPPQTHPRPRTAPITRPMRRSRRVYPRSNRPEPPETRKAQTNTARRKLKRRLHPRHLNEISAIAQTDPPKAESFSTESAHTGLPAPYPNAAVAAYKAAFRRSRKIGDHPNLQIADKPAFCLCSYCRRSIRSQLRHMFCCDAAHFTNPVIHARRMEGNLNRTFAAARSDGQGAAKPGLCMCSFC